MNTFTRNAERCWETGLFGTYHLKQCPRKATIQEDGKGWCFQHAPSKVKAKDDERQARWKREEDVRDAHRAIARAKNAVVAAAEAYVASVRHLEANKNLLHADNAQLVEAVRLLKAAEAKAKELGIVLT